MNTAWIYLLLSTFCNSIGSTLVNVSTMGNHSSKLGVYIFWPFILAVLLFSTNLFFYAQTIRKITFYIAYPFVVSLTIISLTVFSPFYKREKSIFMSHLQ